MKIDLDYFLNQSILFEEIPKRLNLLSLPKSNSDNTLNIKVHRNHSFEMVSSIINYYLNLSNYNARFNYSQYDDSLNFDTNDKYDLQLIWIDTSRYQNSVDLNNWLIERIKYLRLKVKSPILFVYMGKKLESLSNLKFIVPEFYFKHITTKSLATSNKIIDKTRVYFTGTQLNNVGSVLIARKMGCHWIPTIFKTPIKALILDLDNTIYNGVLGEDGIDGIKLTNHHLELQKYIKTLKKNGILLSICSKNIEEDVYKMFKRTDFPLEYSDFVANQINWEAKADNIIKIRKKLRVGLTQ